MRDTKSETTSHSFIGRRRFLASAVMGVAIGASSLNIGTRKATGQVLTTARIFSPEQFGARGDGRTNDHDALVAMATALSAAGGGTVRFTAGRTYLFGKQVRGRSRFYLHGETPLQFVRVPVVVDLNGGILKLVPGLRFGSFNPATGRSDSTETPNRDFARAAHLGRAIHGEDCPLFVVRDGMIDLNSSEQQLGGAWGDKGWQLPCYGVATDNCGEVLWEGVTVVNSALDGFAYHYTVRNERAGGGQAIIRGCAARNVARNCVSLTGGRDILVEDCDFSFGGMAPGASGTFGSAPKSCFDVEAEGGSLVRNVTLRNVRLIAGAGSSTAFVADSGDSKDILLEGCTLDGPVWTSKPGTRFERCTINGVFAKLAGGQGDPGDNTHIINCTIADSSTHADLLPYGSLLVAPGSGPGVVVQGSRFSVERKMLQIGGYQFTGNQVVCRWQAAEHPNGGVIAVAGSEANLVGTSFIDQSSGPIGGDILIVTDGTERVDGGLVATRGGKIRISRT